VLTGPGALGVSMDKEISQVLRQIGLAVKEAQRLQGISDDKLSQRSTVSLEDLALIRSGEKRDLPLHEVYLIAGALKVRPSQLLRGIEWVPDGHGGGTFYVADLDDL
jgi:hypothetical protein